MKLIKDDKYHLNNYMNQTLKKGKDVARKIKCWQKKKDKKTCKKRTSKTEYGSKLLKDWG